MDESLRWGNLETVSSSQFIVFTLSSAGAQRCCTIYQPRQTVRIMQSQNHCLQAKLAYFDFSSSNFTMQDHVLSTAGDALIPPAKMEHPSLSRTEVHLPPCLSPPSLEQKFTCLLVSSLSLSLQSPDSPSHCYQDSYLNSIDSGAITPTFLGFKG